MINIKQAFIQYYFSIEAFIYIWYDAYNKMYYLGKHKGTPDDSYTHSSMSSEEFCSIVPHSTTPINERKEFFKNMPKGVTRRILAYGTDEEMCILENKLLVNRKERCWDRYYNVNAHSKAIGNLYDILSEDGVKLWKERISSSGRKPKPNKDNYQWSKTTTPEERKERFGHPMENNWKWKGGISLGDNRKNYFENDYDERKKLCKELIKQGLSYYEIKEKHKRALIGYPYALIPQEIRDIKNAKAADRYENKRECYCRKDTCDYCFPLKQTPEERKQREAKSSKIRNEKDKLDPIKDAHKKKVAKIWEMNNKEKRRAQKKVRKAEKEKERGGEGTLEAFFG